MSVFWKAVMSEGLWSGVEGCASARVVRGRSSEFVGVRERERVSERECVSLSLWVSE